MKQALLSVALCVAVVASTHSANAGCLQQDFRSVFRGAWNEHGDNTSTVRSVSGSVCGQSFSLTSPVSQSDAENIKNWTSITGTINGATVTFQVGGSTLEQWANSIQNSRTIIATINGRTVTLSTGDSSFRNVGDNSTFSLTVGGTSIYSGLPNNISIQNYLDLLAALGIADSGSVVQQTVARTESQMTATITSSRISSVLTTVLGSSRLGVGRRDKTASGTHGMAAGDTESGIGLWASPSNSWLANTNPVSRFHGTVQNILAGADYKVTPTIVVGAAFGFENSSMTTTFNDGKLDSQGVSITPYVGFSFLDKKLTWDVMGGYTRSFSNQSRARYGLSDVTGDFDGQRWMIATNLNGYIPVADKLTITPTLGVLATWDHRFPFTESDGTRPLKNDSALAEGKGALKATYAFDDFDVSGTVAYLHDFFRDQDITAPNQNDGRNELETTIGASYYPSDNQILNFEVTNSFLRTDTRRTSVQATYRYTF